MIVKYLTPIGMLIGGTILTIGNALYIQAVILSSYINVCYQFGYSKLILEQISHRRSKVFPSIYLTFDSQFFYLQKKTFCYFLGESFCYIFYALRFKKGENNVQETKQISNHQNHQKSSKLPLFALYPAILDGIAMTLQYSSLTLISPSVYQILRGGVIIVTAILSVTVLKRKLNVLNLVGLFVVLLGIVIVGGANLAFGIKQNIGDTSDNNDQIIGYILIIVSLFANGMLFIQEEKIIQTHKNIKPIDLVAFEGVWGIIYYLGFLIVLSLIPCTGRFCVYQDSSSTQGTIESVSVFFNQLSLNCNSSFLTSFSNIKIRQNQNKFEWLKSHENLYHKINLYLSKIRFNQLTLNYYFTAYLLISQLTVLITIGFYAYSAVTVTKNLSAMVRSLIDVSRCLVVWIVGILISIFSDQQWESFNPFGIMLQTVGFLLIVVGSLIYNQILFKKTKYGSSSSITQEFSLQLLEKDDQDHQGYNKLSGHENKHKNHNHHHQHHTLQNQNNQLDKNGKQGIDQNVQLFNSATTDQI